MKRAIRRENQINKIEKRIRLKFREGMLWGDQHGNHYRVDAKSIVLIREEIRQGKYWNHVKHTSTPCSCSMCSPLKYVRPSKGELKRMIEGNYWRE